MLNTTTAARATTTAARATTASTPAQPAAVSHNEEFFRQLAIDAGLRCLGRGQLKAAWMLRAVYFSAGDCAANFAARTAVVESAEDDDEE